MTIATCPPSAELERLVFGGVPESAADPLESHVLACDSCLEKLKSLLRTQDTLVNAVGADTHRDTAAPDPVVDHLVQVLEALRPRMAQALTRGAVMGNEELRTLPPSRSQDAPSPTKVNAPTNPAASKPDATIDLMPAATDERGSLTDFLAPPQGDGELGRLGKYRILKILGHGGMGVVYQAADPKLKRTVAIKAMLPALAASATAAKRFLREAEAMAAVEHDHIVRIYQIDEDRGVPFLAMEFLKGEPLDERLKRDEPLPIHEMLRIGREIAEGLAAAHATGLIHRDIKPGNVWLEAPRGRVKILDFGLARAAAQDSGVTQQGAIVGTPAFMAPEQGRGGTVDARCDLFSLGVVLYRLCTGIQPFQGADTVATLVAVAMHDPVAPIKTNDKVPAALSDLVMKLLEKDPADRVGTAGEVVQALGQIEKELIRKKEAETATPAVSFAPAVADAASVGQLAVVSRRRVRRPRLVAALLLCGLLAAAGGVYGVIRIATPEGDYVIDTDDPDFSFKVAKDTVILEDARTRRKYNLKVVQKKPKGEYELEVADPDSDLAFNTRTFTIKRGEQVALKAWFERKQPEVAKSGSVDEAWLNAVAAMQPEDQVVAIAAKLKERNPGFDGKLTHDLEGAAVTKLEFCTDNVTDLAPVRALIALRTLRCSGSWERKGQLADLAPLKNMKLTFLDCANTKVSDLSPLKDMPLTRLDCGYTRVYDLSPLKDLKLAQLNCQFTRVSDLLPLKNMKLTSLTCDYTRVSDLAPLKDMPLTHLECGSTQVIDLSLLKDMKLMYLGCGGTKVSDLAPLKDMKLTSLNFWGTPVSALAPLKGMPLTFLCCTRTMVSDLAPLKGMPLTTLFCGETSIYDLAPLKDMKLTELTCDHTSVTDLAPLKGLQLRWLEIGGTKVSDLLPLKGMPLKELGCDFKPERDAEILRSLKTLEKINGKPAADFWK